MPVLLLADFVGCTTNPNEAWMKTITLKLTNHEDGFLKDKEYLIMDRDAMFRESFRDCLQPEGMPPVQLPPSSHNLHASRKILRIAENLSVFANRFFSARPRREKLCEVILNMFTPLVIISV